MTLGRTKILGLRGAASVGGLISVPRVNDTFLRCVIFLAASPRWVILDRFIAQKMLYVRYPPFATVGPKNAAPRER